MEKIELMRQVLKDRFGITSEKDLINAFENMSGLDIGIFTCPLQTKGGKDEEI